MTGKRGPNGGIVDVDDPYEVFLNDDKAELYSGLHKSLRLLDWAIRERIAGRDRNADLMFGRATRGLTDAIYSASRKEGPSS